MPPVRRTVQREKSKPTLERKDGLLARIKAKEQQQSTSRCASSTSVSSGAGADAPDARERKIAVSRLPATLAVLDMVVAHGPGGAAAESAAEGRGDDGAEAAGRDQRRVTIGFDELVRRVRSTGGTILSAKEAELCVVVMAETRPEYVQVVKRGVVKCVVVSQGRRPDVAEMKELADAA
ncbi:hypothetical protein BDY21DRAFT_340500 [Lineolata rhizophorae]|uniref:DNA replication factor Cdt1 C-terminal domain-containing protein n=1 Tax=Lineolata rhizophorae TaxID=578093 RepID=A0A6A6P3H9_9PEZI|nr:hypothetical protein BDY21DRAFT_340500 [Lineolata rhizophorae]